MNAIRHAAPQVWTDPVSLRVLGMGTALPGPPVETGALLNLMNTRFGLDLGILARDDYDGAARPGAKLSRVFHGQLGTGHPPGLFATSGGSDCLGVPGGLHEFEHDYAAVWLAGPALLRRCAASALKAGITGADWTLPHQADGRMDELLEKLIGMPRGRVVTGGQPCRQHRVGRDLARLGAAPGLAAARGHGPGAGSRGDGAHVRRVPL